MSVPEYLGRFPQHAAALPKLLSRIAAEIGTEFAQHGRIMPAPAGPAAGRQRPSAAAKTIPSSAAMLETIRQAHLLLPAQLTELGRSLPDDGRALARELLRRGWLTPYQVNQLCQGRGRDLQLGPYRLLERLGEGGAGQVFLARHEKMNRVVAMLGQHRGRHWGPVEAIAVSADGKRVASGGTDGVVWLWDTAAGRELAILKGHTGKVWAVAFAADGKRLASAAEDKTV